MKSIENLLIIYRKYWKVLRSTKNEMSWNIISQISLTLPKEFCSWLSREISSTPYNLFDIFIFVTFFCNINYFLIKIHLHLNLFYRGAIGTMVIVMGTFKSLMRVFAFHFVLMP